MITLLCKQCKKNFQTYPSIVKYSGGRPFCSRECMGKYRTNSIRGKLHPNYVERTKIECLICHKPILVTPFYTITKKYCSRKCKAIAHSIRMSAELNPSWRGGISDKYIRWGKGFASHLKKMVKNRDNYRCQVCGLTEANAKVKFVIHHKDINPKNNDINNLELLCNPCHVSLHRKLVS